MYDWGSGSRQGVKYPEPVTLGTTWDLGLVREVYAAVAEATRAGGAEIAFAPVLNMWTDPRNGRHQVTALLFFKMAQTIVI